MAWVFDIDTGEFSKSGFICGDAVCAGDWINLGIIYLTPSSIKLKP